MIYPYFYIKNKKKKINNQRIRANNLVGILSITLGVGVFISLVFAPIVKSSLEQKYNRAVVRAVAGDFENDPGRITALLASRNLSARQVVLGAFDTRKEDTFFLSIPRLGISRTPVVANSKDPDPEKSLVHILGTALPGSSGNTFITGHSTFKYLFDDKDPKKIFSTIEDLDNDDEIIISYRGREFYYKVFQKETLEPEDVTMYREYFPSFLNKQTVTLMTCWPGGTTKYRILVTAVLAE